MNFLDTNIIIRYLTRDDPDQSTKARMLLEDIQTKRLTVTTCEGVIVEVVQVFSSKVLYNLPREQIKSHLFNILNLTGLKLPHKRTYLRALELYVLYRFLDFVDALNIAYMERQKISQIFTFDRDFDKIPGIKRVSE